MQRAGVCGGREPAQRLWARVERADAVEQRRRNGRAGVELVGQCLAEAGEVDPGAERYLGAGGVLTLLRGGESGDGGGEGEEGGESNGVLHLEIGSLLRLIKMNDLEMLTRFFYE